MKHEFTDDQIEQAAQEASQGLSYAPNRITTTYIRNFLDALPEPQDVWQAGGAEVIELEDVRAGDRIFIESTSGSLYEVTVTEAKPNSLKWDHLAIHTARIERIYLIDRPVVHPDPMNHPAIVLVDAEYYRDHDENRPPIVVVWTGIRYESESWEFKPEQIKEWHPIDVAKVVAEDDR